jgi:hypothetical protein
VRPGATPGRRSGDARTTCFAAGTGALTSRTGPPRSALHAPPALPTVPLHAPRAAGGVVSEPDYRAEVEGLLDEAAALPHGDARVALLESAVQLAETHGDVALCYEARLELIDAATFGGFPDKALDAFTWCRAEQQRAPETFEVSELLWKAKWVVGRLHEFPHIGRERVSAALEELAQAFERAGAGQRALLKLRYQTARDMGDEEAAAAHWRQWIATPRDALTDCEACELDDELDLHLDRGEHEQVLQKAFPLLRGWTGCAEVPQRTYGSVLYPLLKLERLEEAQKLHLHGYPAVARNRDFLVTVGEHLEFLALTHNFARALVLLERHLSWALAHASRLDRFGFLCAAALLFSLLRQEGHEVLTLRLPYGFALHQADCLYATARLQQWAEGEAADIAQRFDARNGTSRYAQLLVRTLERTKDARPFPLEPAAKKPLDN